MYPQVLVRWHGEYPDEWCKFTSLSAAGKEAARRWERGALGVRARAAWDGRLPYDGDDGTPKRARLLTQAEADLYCDAAVMALSRARVRW